MKTIVDCTSSFRVLPRAATLLAISLAVAVTGCGSSSSGDHTQATPAAGGRVNVVAAENFWGDIARQIGGSHVSVTSIISDPSTDPHVYQTDPKDSAAIGRAQLVIENGFGYDDFVTKILRSSGSSGRRVLDLQKVVGIAGENPNPHIWYDTAVLPSVANAIRDQLVAIDPGHRRDYSDGTTQFIRSLRPLSDTVAAIKAKYAGAPIAYTERVPGYLVTAAGLRLATPASFSQAIEDGDDPSPQDTVVFDNDISSGKVKVLLYNAQVVDAQTTKIKQLATDHHVPIVGVTETLPSTDANFQAWQLRQAQELLRALGG